MDEKVNTESVLPETENTDLPKDSEATIPVSDPMSNAYLEIKFNKELIKLDRESAVTLAQKGMKYDQISEEYERLKSQSDKKLPDGIERINREFPEISSPDMLPEEVKTAAKQNGTGLLFEYLLYEHRQRRAAAEEAQNQTFTADSTTGSLSADDRQDPAAAEFLRGVWGK